MDNPWNKRRRKNTWKGKDDSVANFDQNLNPEEVDISYMSAHVLLNLLNELGKSGKIRGLKSILLFFATSLINLIIP